MKNEIKVEHHRIVLTLPNAGDWNAIKFLTGKVKELTPGVFEMALSSQNLNRIHRMFAHNPPVVVGSRRFLDDLSGKLRAYKSYREGVQDVLKKERYPVEPNGKFVPYAHQTKIIGVGLANPFAPICADCGTGKTGSTGRLMELILTQGEVRPGKILVSAPLSILDTSWADDLNKFTYLRHAKLWAPMVNKRIVDETKILLTELGPEPLNKVATKTKTGNWFRHPNTGEVKQKIDVLDGKGWVKYTARWKVAVDLAGVETPYGPVYGRSFVLEKTRENFIRAQLARADVDVFLINHEGVRIYEEILREHEFDWVIVDESTKIKSASAEVSRAHVDISWKCKRRNILTGTPNPNGFEDLWHQWYFLDRGLTLEPAYKDYIAEYFSAIHQGTVHTPKGPQAIVKYVLKNQEAKERLVERVKSVGIFIDQSECLDLPERTSLNRAVVMQPEQEAAYVQMATQLVATLEDEVTKDMVESEALNSLSKILRLRQITSGFLANREGELVRLTNNPKQLDLDDVIEELGGKKIVVVCQFQEEIRLLIERYKHLGACAIYGEVGPAERADNIRRFQEDTATQVIVVHPQAAGHGITLTAASYLSFYSLSYNYEHYYQVSRRIQRIGQKHPMFFLHSVARFEDGSETIDEILLDVMGEKAQNRNILFGSTNAEMARSILDRIKKQVETHNG